MRIINQSKKEGVHPGISELENLYCDGRITRRGFIRNATLLGVSLSSIGTFLSLGARDGKRSFKPWTGVDSPRTVRLILA